MTQVLSSIAHPGVKPAIGKINDKISEHTTIAITRMVPCTIG